MSQRRVCSILVGLVVIAGPASWAAARQEALLDVTAGQVPNDTGSDGATKMTIEDRAELGGKALKVVFASGDSCGDRIARVKDWKQFISLQFDAFNPAQKETRFTLTVKHRRTTSYQTRVDLPFTLRPGKNAVKLGIDEMTNVNGSAPDLANVDRWYLACEDGATPTVYFGTLWLVGDDAVAGPAPAGALPAAGPAGAYRVTGKVGDMPVELMVTPLGGAVPAAGAIALAAAPSAEAKASALVRPSRGQLPNDTGTEMPPITKPVLFNTPEADAILSALEVFPPDNPWNQVVSDWPLHPNSQKIISSIGSEKPLRYNPDMGFVLVPPDQKRVELAVVEYPGESDKGPFPIPDNLPIEGWPVCAIRDANYKGWTLDDIQRDRSNRGGDRHGIVVDPVSRRLYEFFVTRKTDRGWQAAQSSIFDLKTNQLRPDGWTSADAAGLPIFPAVVRYDELKRGRVEHALRVTVVKTRREYVAPATHYASPHTNEEYPRMGERIRLRQDYDVSGFSPEVQTILKGLKKYGMFVADNGIDWALSVAPDERIPVLHEELRKVKGAAFEVVVAPQ